MITQITDRKRFMDMARAGGCLVLVTRTPTVTPANRDKHTVLHPAIGMDYRMDIPDDQSGQSCWTFRETILAYDTGIVDLKDTLWAMMSQDQTIRMEIVHRSGSL